MPIVWGAWQMTRGWYEKGQGVRRVEGKEQGDRRVKGKGAG